MTQARQSPLTTGNREGANAFDGALHTLPDKTDKYASLLNALEVQGWKVQRRGNRARAQCPAHGGDGMNLSILNAADRITAHCHSAGCDTKDVLEALGLTVADRYHEPKTNYHYEDGRTVHRWPDKRHKQSGNTRDTPTLYRRGRVLSAVAADATVYLVEGEPDVLAAEAVGLVATTAPQGASNFHKVDASPLKGATVIAIVDKDEQGKVWAAQVRAKLEPIAAGLTFRQARTGKDLTDHLAAGHDVDDLDPLELEEAPTPAVVTLASVTPQQVSWLWPGRLPVGKLVVIDGDPSTGKSTLTLDLAARVSTGTPWPDSTPCPVGDVLLLSAEDGLADTIAPRLAAAGADLTRVHALEEVPSYTEDGERRMVPPSLPRDIPHIAAIVRKHKVRLIVVDVLMAYLGKVDSHKDQDIRGVLHQLAALAESAGCTIVLIRHLNKAGGSNALYRGGGSIGIVGAARAAFLVARDPEDEDRRLFANTKMNIAIEPPTLAYRLVSAPGHGCARVVWEPAPVGLTANDLLRTPEDPEERTERDEAAEWLRGFLEDAGGTATAKEIYRAGRADGFQERRLQRARDRAKVTSRRQGFGAGSQMVWTIDDTPDPIEDINDTPKSAVVYGGYGEGVSGMGEEATPKSDTTSSQQRRQSDVTESAVESLTDHLRKDPARCPGCGWHVTTQGHAATCTRKDPAA